MGDRLQVAFVGIRPEFVDGRLGSEGRGDNDREEGKTALEILTKASGSFTTGQQSDLRLWRARRLKK